MLALSGCGWEPLVPPQDSVDEAPASDLQVQIVYDCKVCGQAEATTSTMTFTFRAVVTLPDPERETVLVYSWDFGDGTKDEGESVKHTYGRPGTYRVRLRVITSTGAEAQDEMRLTVQAPPKPEPKVQRDVLEGQLCTFERVLPETIRLGEPFTVQVTIEAKADVQVVTWEDNVWFPEFRLLQDPFQLWIGLKAGQRQILRYDVELWQTPAAEDVWMSGTLSCNPGGFSDSEVLTLKSQLNIVEGSEAK
jgi:hypothetical protein